MRDDWRTRASWKLWQWSCRGQARAFERALHKPEVAQFGQLRAILSLAENAAWAREFGIHATTTVDDFRERVPVHDPGDLEPWTERLVRGEERVLTSARPERLVPTSGTTGRPKLIPMTAQSRREFSTGVNLWMYDAMRQVPAIKRGLCYIATSPALDVRPKGVSAVPVGFAKDSAYLGRIEKRVLHQLLAVPESVSELRDAAWRAVTRRHLLEATDLRFLSLWHPGYLGALFDEEELADLASRWKRLALVSTWADGACAQPARELMESLPQARHQPKGLWLTEGVVSIPWQGTHPLALPCGFFEFEDRAGAIWLAHELEVGHLYRPILTNCAGLYRYRTGDLVKVAGYIHETPTLRWVGRADAVSDLCGEKLSEADVSLAFEKCGWSGPGYIFPVSDGATAPHYECALPAKEAAIFPLTRMEAELARNPHYKWARSVGQLAPLTVCRLEEREMPGIHAESRKESTLHKKASRLFPAPKLHRAYGPGRS